MSDFCICAFRKLKSDDDEARDVVTFHGVFRDGQRDISFSANW